MHPPSLGPFLLLHRAPPRRDSLEEMPPPYQPEVFPSRLAARKGAPPPPLAVPPPYCSTKLSPSADSPGLEDDPHYLSTPTQRAYFVGLSSMFEESACKSMVASAIETPQRCASSPREGGW